MALNINMTPVALKLEEIIKQVILDGEHYVTGNMYRSINVKATKAGKFKIDAIYYYKYVDGRFGITNQAMESDEFKSFLAEYMAEQINRLLILPD